MFIGRRDDGTIYGTWTVRQWKGQEELPDDNSEVMAFVNRPLPQPQMDKADKLRAELVVQGVLVSEIVSR